jgi:hypothetical protein
VSAVNVLPLTAPSRSPGAGLPTTDFGKLSVIVPSELKLIPGSGPTEVSVGTPMTKPTTCAVEGVPDLSIYSIPLLCRNIVKHGKKIV